MLRILLPLALAVAAASGYHDRSEPSQIFNIKEAAVHIEYSATSGEATVVFEAESETAMHNVKIHGPDGTPVMHLQSGSGGDARVSGFIIETEKNTAERVMAAYAPGHYSMSAVSARGFRTQGGADLSHALLPAPLVLYPREGDIGVVPTTTITWVPDTNAVAYHVVLEQDENDGLTVTLPAGTNSLTVPAGVLRSQTISHVEVGAVDKGGNITLVEIEFTTL